jgi:hypothetical protein
MSSQCAFPRAFRPGAAMALVVGALAACSGDLTVPGGDPGADPVGVSQPVLLQAVAGDGQRAEAGAVLDRPLAVVVVDSGDSPVSGVPVRFAFLGEVAGAALDPEAVLTNGEGRAEAIVRLGEQPGEQVIIAAVDNTLLPALRATFTATAVPPHGGRDRGRDGDSD